MSRLIAPICPHPNCGERIARGYVRQGKVYAPTHWICPICGNVSLSKEKDNAPL